MAAFPMLSMFLTDDMIEKVTRLFKTELEEFLRDTAQSLAVKLEKNVDVKNLVKEKVQAFSSNQIEDLLFKFMEREFRFIEKIGALLGFSIGCIQVILFQVL